MIAPQRCWTYKMPLNVLRKHSEKSLFFYKRLQPHSDWQVCFWHIIMLLFHNCFTLHYECWHCYFPLLYNQWHWKRCNTDFYHCLWTVLQCFINLAGMHSFPGGKRKNKLSKKASAGWLSRTFLSPSYENAKGAQNDWKGKGGDRSEADRVTVVVTGRD